jgi:hypothetical protein
MLGRLSSRSGRRLRRDRRGTSPGAAAAVLVIVAIVVGAGGYYGVKGATSSSTSTTCQPSSTCKPTSATNDVSVFIPYTPGFGQELLSVAIGQSIPATVSLTGGETASSYAINWGDGATDRGTQGTFSHAYTGIGLFVIFANATVGGTVHTGSNSYFPIATTQSITNLSLGYFPTLRTTFTNTSGGMYPWIVAGGTVSVSGRYSAPPVDLAYTTRSPSLVATGGVRSDYVNNSTAASATYTFSNPGIYDIKLVGPVVTGATTVYQNYTWEVDVLTATALGPSCSECNQPKASSPHPGTLNVVEDGGPPIGGLDPSYDYDTVGEEPIWNIFETLIAYNGTQVAANPGSYLPEIATCVPGGAECGAQYPTAPGTDLVVNNGSVPQYWTFVIDKTARFYDPTTGNAQPVYPIDVMFSVARAVSYANLPGPGYYNGFILGQALLPNGNVSWDKGTHYPYNNTPSNILGSMLINDTSYCPTAAMTGEHGCITFDAYGGGVAWPNFLQLIADPLGGSIEECSFYVHIGVAPSGFTANGPNTPCNLPGGVAGNTTNSSAWHTYLNTLSPTLWDTYQINAGATYPVAAAASRLVAAGSGPYRLLSAANFEIGYVLEANPYYVQPAGCTGLSGFACLPAPGAYANRVNVQWELSDQQGIADFEAGYADYAAITPADTTTLITLLQKGLLGVETAPTLSIAFLLMNLQIDLTSFKSLDIYPSDIQANTFSYIGLRDFLATAIPYATIESTLFTVDGIQYFFNYGGFIPQGMANYYPSNVSFPNYNVTSGQFTNPGTSPSQPYSMAWYWSQLNNPSSPIYDPQFGPGPTQYNSHHPLVFPLIGETDDTALDSTYSLMVQIISTATGGAIQPDTFDLSFSQLGANIGLPGQTGLGFWNLAWAPDYANPWDYAIPLVLPNSTYNGPDAIWQTFDGLYGGQYANASDPICTGHIAPTLANLSYWANRGDIPQDCQGIAYNITTAYVAIANANPNLAQGKLEYDQADAIYSELALTIPDGQTNSVVTYAPWINPETIDTNIVVSAGAVTNAWFDFGGNGVVG